MGQRVDAIGRAETCFDSGDFRRTLARRIALPTESQNPERADVLRQYLETEVVGRPLVWPRHRGQQGPAHHQHGGAADGAGALIELHA